uniref:Uncharacterized protein n=1 Tax=Anopheles maculatus TaxID=74869 RepID=A0A182T4H5_9DIPT
MRPTARPQQFSKSAPNLDKSRATAMSASSSRHEILGKSHDDGLHAIEANRNYSRTNTTTTCSSNDNNNSNINRNRMHHTFQHYHITVPRTVDSNNGVCSSNRRNHAQPSNPHHPHHMHTDNSGRAQSEASVLGAGCCDGGCDDWSGRGNKTTVTTPQDGAVEYDRVFYNNLQQSIENIFSRKESDANEFDYAHSSAGSQCDTMDSYRMSGSRSSDNLTSYWVGQEWTRSKFKRENYLVGGGRESNGVGTDGDSAGESRSSTVSTADTRSVGQLQESFGNLDLSGVSDGGVVVAERPEEECSLVTHAQGEPKSSSRKSSVVTFRPNVDVHGSEYESIAGPYLLWSQSPSPAAIEAGEDSSTNDGRPHDSLRRKFGRTKKKLKLSNLLPFKRTRASGTERNDASNKTNKRRLVHRNNSIYLRRPTAVNSSTTTEQDQLLLIDGETGGVENESPYAMIRRTDNYLIVQSNENYLGSIRRPSDSQN